MIIFLKANTFQIPDMPALLIAKIDSTKNNLYNSNKYSSAAIIYRTASFILSGSLKNID